MRGASNGIHVLELHSFVRDIRATPNETHHFDWRLRVWFGYQNKEFRAFEDMSKKPTLFVLNLSKQQKGCFKHHDE